MVTAFGATAVTFMMVMYALERRHRGFVLAFACGCALSSAYGFLAGTWPFGVVEAIWALIALRRYTARPVVNGGSRESAPAGARTRLVGAAEAGEVGGHADDSD
jgi:hypothetical protein